MTTHNYTISRPPSGSTTPTTRGSTAEQRAAGRKADDELIATAGFPKKPDGSPMTYRTAAKFGAIFEASKNKAKAKEFLKFLMEEDNLYPTSRAPRPLVPGDQRKPGQPLLAGRQASQGGGRPVQGRHTPFEFTKN